MEAGGLYGIVDTEPAGACRTNDIALHAGLRDQELKGSFQVGLLSLGLGGLSACAAAFAIAAGVDCERVDSSSR